MVAWLVKDFGGMIPRQNPRLLPDNMAEVAINVDLAGGPLDGLTEPKFIIDLTGKATFPVRKAYRFPGPTITDPDLWIPLPSEFSSVVKSPLANDTQHRIYWTNPPGQPAAGAYWNTYARLAAGGLGINADYNLGFLPPDPATVLTVTVSGGTTTVPQIARSYCFTYVDQYNSETSPCPPSAVVEGPPDAIWRVSGLPTVAPVSPAGKNYPTIAHLRLYRTVTGTTTGGQFFFVADLPVGASFYDDIIPDTTVVNNNVLDSTSWAPPLENLDGLISMTGGMLIGFTDNTLHFCEPDRPHAWPAGYDQSLLYQIVGLAIWQQSLVVLTQGYPSMGAGTSPSNMQLQQVQAPEPCIARGSIVTDLAGVYYSSQNGLIMLSYFGMTNQTLSNMTRTLWLGTYKGGSIIACRHRTQYLAINGTGTGFLIDYSEQRMGVVGLSTFLNAVSVWNDVYTGDAYICADQKVYLWDDNKDITGAAVQIILRASFTAPDNTHLEDYNFVGDIGAHFINLTGGDQLTISSNRLTVPLGSGVYQASGMPSKPDYTVSFSVFLPPPPIEDGDTMSVTARAIGVATGYTAKVSYALATGYTVSVLVNGTSVTQSLLMGPLSGETQLDLKLSLFGSTISLAVVRNSDRRSLTSTGSWQSDATATAITFTDTTYTLPGAILVGASG